MSRSSLTVEHFFNVVGRSEDPTASRDAEVADLLEGAENKILAFTSPNGDPANGVWVDAICKTIQMDMIKRAFKNPDLVSNDALGPQSRAFPAPGGLFLLPGEREELERLKGTQSAAGGLYSIRTYRRDFYDWCN
jgi:hypothetical protein